MKHFIIYNNVSGLAYNRFSGDDVKGALKDAGIDFEFFTTNEPGESIRVARQACGKVDGPIVACGGDGTINEVVNGIMDSGRPLGIIPNGTSNLLAGELGVKQDLKSACAVLAEGNVRRMDVGKAGSRYFLMMAGVGFDADSIKETDHA
ncbi:MAG: diacylglycerol kinase family protein, partial [Candidatus Omnitrophota bacterium]